MLMLLMMFVDADGVIDAAAVVDFVADTVTGIDAAAVAAAVVDVVADAVIGVVAVFGLDVDAVDADAADDVC